MTIDILRIIFNNRIQFHEVSLFRGAVIHSLKDKPILFHNHSGDSLRYGYPLIQYKSINNRAAIVCVGEGAEEVWQFFEDSQFDLHIGYRVEQMSVSQLSHEDFSITFDDIAANSYHISHWLPLNEDNYKTYLQTKSLTKRITLLERLLTGNILSMLKGIGIHADRRITVSIQAIMPTRPTTYKKVKLMMFDVSFTTNIQLPDYVGLGRHTSVGYGMVTKIKKQ